MSTSLQFDKDASDRLVAMYVTPDLVSQRNQVLQAFSLHPGDHVLDIGSGPGFLASAMGEAVGPSGWVCGVDVSEPLLAVAKKYCAHQSQIEFRQGDATKLPFPDHQFDAAVSAQVLEYVSDIKTALTEIYRVLRPAGQVVILDTDWDSIVWHTTNRGRMNRIMAAWEQHAIDPYLPRTLAEKLRQAGFQVEEQQIIPMFNPIFGPNTFSNCLIDLIVPYVSDRNGVTRDEAAAWAQELRQRGEQEEYFFSLNRYLFIAKKP